MATFRILLEELEINMYLGIHQFEQDRMQRVLVSCDISIEAAVTDGDPAFDYDRVAEFIRGFKGKRVATQEELTTAIHAFIGGFAAVTGASVHSRKPDVYADCKSVGVIFSGG